MSPDLVAPVLAGGAALLAGRALADADRHRLQVRAGAAAVPGPRVGLREVLRTRVRPSGGARPRRGLAPSIALGALGAAAGVSLAGPVGGLAGAAAGAWVPGWRRRRRESRRTAVVEEQLADAMDGIAAALRAGMSPSQAIAFACGEGAPPLADELRSVALRESLGMPLDESLEVFAREDGTDDVRLAVSVLQLQHRVGGDAPAVLDDAVRTLRQRVAAAAELRSLTAQARLSGTILGLLPIGFFLFMSVVSRGEVQGALASPAGLAAVVVGLLLDLGAFLWIRHLLGSGS